MTIDMTGDSILKDHPKDASSNQQPSHTESLAGTVWELCKENKLAAAAVGVAALGMGLKGLEIAAEEIQVGDIAAELSKFRPVSRDVVRAAWKYYFDASTQYLKAADAIWDRSLALGTKTDKFSFGNLNPLSFREFKMLLDRFQTASQELTRVPPALEKHVSTLPAELRSFEIQRVRNGVLSFDNLVKHGEIQRVRNGHGIYSFDSIVGLRHEDISYAAKNLVTHLSW